MFIRHFFSLDDYNVSLDPKKESAKNAVAQNETGSHGRIGILPPDVLGYHNLPLMLIY